MSGKYLFLLLFWLTCFGFGQKNNVVDVKILGAKKTKSAFLEKIIQVKKGVPLDSVILLKDVERLKRLPSIAHAYSKVFSNENGATHVVFTIEENFTIIPYANVYASSDDDFAFRIGIQEFNLLGRNMIFGGFYQYDNYNSVGVNLRAPYLINNRIGLALNYKNLTTEEPVFFDSTTANYKYNNKGFELMGLYEFNFENRIELGFSLFTEEYSYLSGATSAAVPQFLNVDKHLFKFIYNYDNVKYYYQYLEGFRSMLNLQYVGSSDENLPEFLIGFNDFIYYRRMGANGNWASRLRLGLASNMKTPFAPFTVDNNVNIRGVGNTIDRGTGAVVLNTEYRHTFIDKSWFAMQGNIFIDGGSWRNPGGRFSDFGDRMNLRIYPGIGLRFIHKRIFNAIFRIDYGYGITNNAAQGIVFGIGQYF